MRKAGKTTTTKDVEAEFDAKAATYESNRLGPWYRAQNQLVLRHLGHVQGTVLDVGCGTGWLLRRLVATHPDAYGVGVDLSLRMVEVARTCAAREGARRLEFIAGDWEADGTQSQVAERLPQGASLIVCVSAFHYFRRPVAALRAMRETLAPGGRLLLLERGMDGSPATAVWDFLHRRFIQDHVRFYRTREIVALLGDAGFPEVRILSRIRRLLWRGKLHTSLVLLSAVADPH